MKINTYIVIFGILTGILALAFSNLANRSSSELNRTIMKSERNLFTIHNALVHTKEQKELIENKLLEAQKTNVERIEIAKSIYTYRIMAFITQIITILCLALVGFIRPQINPEPQPK